MVCAGVRGSDRRSLSAQLCKSASFFVEVSLDIERTMHIVFKSRKMKYKHAPATEEPQISHHTPGTIGECSIFFKRCPYQNENYLKRVHYVVPEAQLRAWIIDIKSDLALG